MSEYSGVSTGLLLRCETFLASCSVVYNATRVNTRPDEATLAEWYARYMVGGERATMCAGDAIELCYYSIGDFLMSNSTRMHYSELDVVGRCTVGIRRCRNVQMAMECIRSSVSLIKKLSTTCDSKCTDVSERRKYSSCKFSVTDPDLMSRMDFGTIVSILLPLAVRIRAMGHSHRDPVICDDSYITCALEVQVSTSRYNSFNHSLASIIGRTYAQWTRKHGLNVAHAEKMKALSRYMLHTSCIDMVVRELSSLQTESSVDLMSLNYYAGISKTHSKFYPIVDSSGFSEGHPAAISMKKTTRSRRRATA